MNGWTQQQVDDLKRKGHKDQNEQRKNSLPAGAAISLTDMELPSCNAPLEAKKSERLDTQGRIRVRITGFRNRLTDPDGQSGKAVIDGLVLAGILADDSAKQIESVEIRQVQI